MKNEIPPVFSYPQHHKNGVVQETIWSRHNRMGELKISYLPDDIQWRVDILEDRTQALERHLENPEIKEGGWVPFQKAEDTDGDCFFDLPEGEQLDGVSAFARREISDGIGKDTILYRFGAFKDNTTECCGAIQFRIEAVYPISKEDALKQNKVHMNIHLDGLYVPQDKRELGIAAGLIATAQDTIVHHVRLIRGFTTCLQENVGRKMETELKIATPADSTVRQRVLRNLENLNLPQGYGVSQGPSPRF